MSSDVTPKELLESHLVSGEPLDEDEVELITSAGLSTWTDWSNRGDGLYWHIETYPELENDIIGFRSDIHLTKT